MRLGRGWQFTRPGAGLTPRRSEPWKRFEQESGLFGRKAYGLCVNGSERELALSGMPFEREEVKIQKTLGNRNRA